METDDYGQQEVKPRLRVGLVGLDPLRALGFSALFDKNPRVEIVPLTVCDAVHEKPLDMVLLGGQTNEQLFEVMTTLRNFRPQLRVVVLGPSGCPEFVQKVIGAGAKGFLAETASENEVVMAIEVVQEGSIWAPRKIMSQLLENPAPAKSHVAGTQYGHFTGRERQVLQLLIAGRSNREAAKALGIEERTIKAHVASLMRKVGVQNRIALTVHALTHDLLGSGSIKGK